MASKGRLSDCASALDPAGTRANMVVNISDSQTLAVKGEVSRASTY
jgi:hypothetical protein